VPIEFVDRLRVFARKWGDSIKSLGWAFLGDHCCELCGQFTAAGNFGVPHELTE